MTPTSAPQRHYNESTIDGFESESKRVEGVSDSGNLNWLPRAGEISDLIRARNWDTAAIGGIPWPQTLRTALVVCLNSPVPMMILWGPNLALLYNSASIPFLGTKHPGVFGKPARTIFPDIAQVLSALPRADAKVQRSVPKELMLPGASGRYVNWTVTPVPADNGKPGGLLLTKSSEAGALAAKTEVIWTNKKPRMQASEQKRAEQALKISEAHLQALLQSVDDICFEIDEKGRFLNIWSPDNRFLPAPKSEMIGNRVSDFFGKETTRKIMKALNQVLECGNPEKVDYTMEMAGSKHWFHARLSPVRIEQETPEKVCMAVRDVTELIQTGNALHASEEGLRVLLDSVRDYAIFMLDPEGHVLTWNLGAERINGYTASEVIGKHFSILYPKEDAESGKPESVLQRARAEGRIEHEGWRVRKNGSRFWANVVITALRDSNGNLLGFSKVTRDVTERKMAEESLRELSGLLLRLQDEERRRMARELHDGTAQTLSALSLNLALMNKYTARIPQAAKVLNECLTLAEQASRELRTISYLLHPPMLDEAGLAQTLRWYVEGFTRRTQIQVELEIGLPDNESLPQEIERTILRVVQECLTNVYRHSGSSASGVRLDRSDHEITLKVWDEGKGIPGDLLDQSEDSAAKLGVGILGMRERVRQLGGQMSIQPRNPGTLVEVTLPLSIR